jgi:hypothetical protein
MKPMTEESAKKQKAIEVPDHIGQEMQERDRRDQIKQNEDFAKKLAQMSQQEREEREELEKELERMKEIEFGPETKTDEELRLEDERTMQLLDQMREEGSY